jgi:hypothetical protein
MTRTGNKKQFLPLVVLLFSYLMTFGCATTTPLDPYAGKAYITIHSHPQGAKIYSNGQYLGETPAEDWSWELDYDTRTRGKIAWGEVVFVRDGYLPVRKTYELELDPSGKKRYYFHDLVILESDPNTPRHSNTTSNRQHITIKQEESGLDQLLKAGQIGLILQSLKPIR